MMNAAMMPVYSLKNPWMRAIASLYFAAKRHYYHWRYPNLKLAPGVMVRGSLRIRGPVQVSIASQSRIAKHVEIYGSGAITIGRNVSLNGCWFGCQSAIHIGDDCLISDCYIVDTDYHNLEPRLRHRPPGPKVTAPISIERNVWIGANATVMKGVCIGKDSVIGLGCVVRRSVPPGVVVIGNPQQIVREFQPNSLSEPSSDEGRHPWPPQPDDLGRPRAAWPEPAPESATNSAFPADSCG